MTHVAPQHHASLVSVRLTCACQTKPQNCSPAAAQTILQDASARLTALGVCSGDMLWVHTQQGAVPMECTQPVLRCSAPTPSAHAAAASAGARHGLLEAHNAPLQPPPRQACADAAEARHQAAMQVTLSRISSYCQSAAVVHSA